MTDDAPDGGPIDGVHRIFERHGGRVAAFEEVLSMLCTEAGWDYAEIWVPEPPDRLSCLACHWLDDRYEEFVPVTTAVTFEAGEGLPGRIWASGDPEAIPDLAVLPSHEYLRTASAAHVGLRRAYGVPIHDEGATVGVLVGYAAGGAASEPARRVTERFARVLGGHLRPPPGDGWR